MSVIEQSVGTPTTAAVDEQNTCVGTGWKYRLHHLSDIWVPAYSTTRLVDLPIW